MIQDGLEKVVLKEDDVLEEAGQPTAHVYFPIDALISIRAGVERGTGIEVASVGHDSMTAPGLLLGDPLALGESVVQSGGWAWRLPAPAARPLAERHPDPFSHVPYSAQLNVLFNHATGVGGPLG